MEDESYLEDIIVIGFDSEYVYNATANSNHILSYQYFGRTTRGTWSDIIYTEGFNQKDRLNLKELIGKAIEHGRKEKKINYQWPRNVIVTAHFSRADLASFKDFLELKSQFDSLRKSYSTITRPYFTQYIDSSNNHHPLRITLIDTMNITPGGKGLAVLGEMYALPKITIPSGMIQQMNVLLKKNRKLFERYAIRDAEISALHLWEMLKFRHAHFNDTTPPTTLGSLAEQHLMSLWQTNNIEPNSIVGNEFRREREWNPRTRRYQTRNRAVPIPQVHEHNNLATECFHGGRSEAYVFGFTELGEWTDFDLKGAYTTAMAAIASPDYRNMRVSTKVEDYLPHQLGLARVEFQFPPHPRFPCLPVRTSTGLVFPLEGTTNVGSPEIYLARKMGAKIDIAHGIIIPRQSKIRPFQLFSESIQRQRGTHTKGTAPELIWKEMGNSVYGKLAQGLQRKRVFDSRSEQSRVMPPSNLTQPYLAAYTTSLLRAVLGEILHNIPSHRTVVSATTDGFISNVRESELNLSGRLCKYFKTLRKVLTKDASILENKHVATQVLCWKTRGQATVDVTGQGLTPMIAKAGIKPPETLIPEAYEQWEHPYDEEPEDDFPKHVHNDYIVDLFLNREAGQKTTTRYLTSMRDMHEKGSDLIPIEKEINLNMEYDWKRELMNPTLNKNYFSSIQKNDSHIYAISNPWQNVENYNATKELFEQWRLKEKGLLKTTQDWSRWQEFVVSEIVSKKGVQRTSGGLLGQAKINFLKAYTRKLWGLPGDNYRVLAEYLTSHGYPTTVDDIKNAKRSIVGPVEKEFPRKKNIEDFINIIQQRFPTFQSYKFYKD